jgi:hypothetical protein
MYPRGGPVKPSALAVATRVAIAMVTLFSVVGVLSTEVATATVHGTAPDPTVSGPILPSSGIEPNGSAPFTPAPLGTSFPLSEVGYEQSEYFISGTANSYVPTDFPGCYPSCTAGPSNGQWSVKPILPSTYKTRVVVYRPTDPRKFNGTVMVEWLNVTTGQDLAADWLSTHNELIRDGFAWVGVSAQSLGVTDLAGKDPGRYGTLSVPNINYSYDVFSQAGQAIWDNSALLLGGLTPQHLIAMGDSQSADFLTNYIDAAAPLVNVYDGYLVESRIYDPTPPDLFFGDPAGYSVTVAPNTQFRTDIGVPVFEFETETDVAGTTLYDRQPNTNQFRLWEVAGSSHIDAYDGAIDTGNGQGAVSNLVNMQNPPTSPGCDYPMNAGGSHWVLNAAVWWLNRWVVDGVAPPIPPLLEVTTTPGEAVVFATDQYGNVLGGVRSPQVDAPIATLSGVGNSGGGLCNLDGRTIPFSPTQIARLYPIHFWFVLRWYLATLKDFFEGYLLLPDAIELDNAAVESDIG